MGKRLILGSVGFCFLACGAPDEGDFSEPTAEATSAITIPDDPRFGEQWGLRNTGQLVLWTTFEEEQTFLVAGVPGADINAALAWDITQGSSSIKVGVAETGDVDVTHEDLRDQIFRNQGEIAGDGIDNDGNGCIDDDRGCDFVNQDGVAGPFFSGHATHVSGIVAGRAQNGKGISGVAPKIKLVPLTAEVQNDTFIQAIDYAEANGIRIINCSQGSHEESFQNPDVRAAMAASNVLFVCSGGNRGTPRLNFPSSNPGANILAVANVTNIGELSDHSSYGSDAIDIAAPGRSILSTEPGNLYDTRDGTSQAAPHVAGVAALVMNKFPSLTAAQVADRITRTAMRMTTLTGMVRANGMVDARAALEDVGPIQPNATSIAGRITVTWSAQPGATRYEVERDGAIVNNGTATTHVHSGLAVDSGHVYRVRAFVGTTAGAWSYRLLAKASSMPTSEPFVRQSPHPYPNDFERSYLVRKPGATRLRVHVARLDSLPGDTLEYFRAFQDERESIDERLSGNYPNGFWTHWVNADRFNFDFLTDSSGTAFGFSIDRIEYFGVNRNPTQISIGTEHGCVRVSDGAVRCWGENGRGQLGLGNSDGALEQVGDDETPAELDDVNLGGLALSVSAGHEHNCAVLSGGSLRCWGFGTFGRLGYGNQNTIGDDETPAAAGSVPVGGSVVQVSAGTTHTCAVLSGGAVRCWGNGANGRLGYGNVNNIGDNETPASAGTVNVGGAVSQIAAGGDHTCALLTSGAVRCWGEGGAGQLGYGNTNDIGDNETPASAGNVNLGGTAVAIDVGLSHSCALLTTGAVRCWGNGNGGKLGYGNTNTIGDNETPASAGNVNVGGTVASISVATNRTCAVLAAGGGMRCWGNGAEFPLGYGNLVTIGDNETPASAGNISLGAAVAQAAAGEQHICALLVNGEVRCWGDPAEGRLGLPDFLVTIGDNELPTAFPTIEVL